MKTFSFQTKNNNSCNECNENFSTLKLKYNDTVYWLCDDCYVEHLKEDETIKQQGQ
jgi:hypothetical protein